MKGNARCFLLDEQKKYTTEISYAEMQRRREQDAHFRERRFIALYGMLLEVVEKDYHAFEKARRRERYHHQQQKNGEESTTAALAKILRDASISFETELIDRLMLEKLRDSLRALSAQEYELIEALYFCPKSGPEYAAEIGISKQAVSRRKQKILEKFKILMET